MNDITSASRDVEKFHAQNGFAIGEPFPKQASPLLLMQIAQIGLDLKIGSQVLIDTARMSDNPTDKLLGTRMHLIAEEVAESFKAASILDLIGFLDGLADALYVILGTDVSYELHLGAVFDEIQRSNMTKSPVEDDPDRARLRKKGPYYIAPDIAGIVSGRWTKLQALERQAAIEHITPLELLKSWRLQRWQIDAHVASIGSWNQDFPLLIEIGKELAANGIK